MAPNGFKAVGWTWMPCHLTNYHIINKENTACFGVLQKSYNFNYGGKNLIDIPLSTDFYSFNIHISYRKNQINSFSEKIVNT